MELALNNADIEFQSEVRAYVAANLDKKVSEKVRLGYGVEKSETDEWTRILNRKGWAAPHWPVEVGGAQWSAVRRHLFDIELRSAHAPELQGFGFSMVGPAIIKYGSDEQKNKYLPKILNAEMSWCQGYSEPQAGSDLASLRTTATSDGDNYVVNGSKIWTSAAELADHIFVLVKTDTDVKPQLGISFLLIDMETPGITVEPIVLVDQTPAPEQEVNQVFFSDVRVPQANRVGKENDGWTVAKYLLEFERGNAYAGGLHGGLARIRTIAELERTDGGRLIDDPAFSAKLAALEVQATAVEFTELRTLSALSAGQRVGASSSILKCQGSSMTQEVGELAVEAAAYYANPFDQSVLDYGANIPPIGPDYTMAAAGRYFNQRKATIYGGSNEVQHEIVAKHILGM